MSKLRNSLFQSILLTGIGLVFGAWLLAEFLNNHMLCDIEDGAQYCHNNPGYHTNLWVVGLSVLAFSFGQIIYWTKASKLRMVVREERKFNLEWFLIVAIVAFISIGFYHLITVPDYDSRWNLPLFVYLCLFWPIVVFGLYTFVVARNIRADKKPVKRHLIAMPFEKMSIDELIELNKGSEEELRRRKINASSDLENLSGALDK